VAATPSSVVPEAEEVLRTVRERLADDLDAPGALAAIDAWADAVLATPPGPDAPDAPDARAAVRLIRDTADALLGVAL
jgi:L-cysteine:1D-myo-inositol 2-amino-2-deoxy-alpha-D-glucopyranoside ligase